MCGKSSDQKELNVYSYTDGVHQYKQRLWFQTCDCINPIDYYGNSCEVTVGISLEVCSYGVLDWLQKETGNGRFRLGEKRSVRI